MADPFIVSLRPMDADRIAEWAPGNEADYRDSRIQAGESVEVATARAHESFEKFFPGGAALPTHRIFDILADAGTDGGAGPVVVGYLWIGPQDDADPAAWWVWGVEIFEQHRRRGHARAALLLGEDVARSLGATSLGLNVFGFNSGAKELYESLGYAPTAIQMKKPL